VRLYIFLSVFAVMAILETICPRRERTVGRSARWFINIALSLVNGAAVKIVFGAAAVGTAVVAKEGGWGILNYYNVTGTEAHLFAFVLLDFAIYLQHVVTHALPILWRLHIIHHTDLDLDVTSGIRFHPLEIIVSMTYKIVLVAAIGPDPAVVILFEVLLNGSSVFNHSNLFIPKPLDRAIRAVIVTPEMHRVHHSVEVEETNSNFGFFFSFWDRLCGTYRHATALPPTEFPIGVSEYRSQEELGLGKLLLIPASPKLGDYSMRQK
jgi:sterol desaturase/sphingolipid hydroxylase (fatty acid hydroxylase superfamily)